MAVVAEYICHTCGHEFPWFSGDTPDVYCPRCGSYELQKNPWLLGTPNAEDVTEGDHFAALLAV